ncbi:hypothetical protein DTL42_06620 [Bremerella cremea]|uniref:Uncharacterized protein n=1 Tax=Bremerella cremea TaxID=1031537 RepID=A0A368KYR1_9BACT|nr:hypothetical protein [Bremerella cremea]RCS54794.1 hypothetical protein DTL42_06620 [Bremerella cremea]
MTDTTENTHDKPAAAEHGHAESTAPSYDDLNTPMIALIGFLSAVVTFICIIGLQAAYLQYSTTHEAEMRNVPFSNVDSLVTAQQAKLNSGYSWVNKETKTIAMPIDQAMKVVAEQYESN